MKEKNELKQYMPFQLNECEAVKEHLEDMALKGWKLKKIQTFFYYEKIEPQRLNYAVEVLPKASVYATAPSDYAKEYIEYCREAGWDFICYYGQVNVFVSESTNTIPIETDEKAKYKTIVKGILKLNAINWFILPVLFSVSFIFGMMNYSLFITSELSLLSLLFYIIYLIFIAAQFTSFIIWTVIQRHRLKNGLSIKHISKKDQKLRTKIRMIPLVLTLSIIIYMIFQSFLQNDTTTAFSLILIILLPLVIYMFLHFLQNGAYSKNKNIFMRLCLGLCLCLIVGIFGDLLATLRQPKPMPEYLQTRTEKNILVDISESHQALDNGRTVRITVFKSKYDIIINQYLFFETHDLFFLGDCPIQKDQPEWGAISVIETKYMLYLEYTDSVISFYSDVEYSQAFINEIKSLSTK